MKTFKAKLNSEQSGQALVELAFAFVLLCVFIFGTVDFGRAIYQVEVLKNLVGEGSMMASRDSETDLATTVTAVSTYAGADINLSTLGCVIVTSVSNTGANGALVVTGQASQAGITCSSKVGCLNGVGTCKSSSAVLPTGAATALQAEPSGSSVYVTEIFYNYKAVTPVPALLGTIMPSQFYSVAYY